MVDSPIRNLLKPDPNILKEPAFSITLFPFTPETSAGNKKPPMDVTLDSFKLNPEAAPSKPVSFLRIQFFQATRIDFLVIFFAVIGSFGVGLSQPLYAWIYGDLLNSLSKLQQNPTLLDEIVDKVYKFYIFATGIFVAGLIMLALWIYNGKITSEKIRTHYFRTIMQQEQGWFDSNFPFEFSTKVHGQITKIDNSLGEKVSTLTMSVAQIITAYTIAFTTSWKLSIVIITILPIFVFAGFFISKSTREGLIRSRKAYEKAGGIAEEVLYNIKTVASFGNFEYEQKRFDEKIDETYKANKDTSLKTSIGTGIVFIGFFTTFAISIGYGAYIIYMKEHNPNTGLLMNTGDVMTVLFSMMYAAYSFGSCTPVLKAVLEACDAAVEFFSLMERKPKLDRRNSIAKPNKDQLSGKIIFKNVHFTYPTIEKLDIFKGFDLTIEPFKRTALVGHSGCGKSTILSLILRLYDIQKGEIWLDNYDLKTLDINYLRSIIGYVPQEPVLFNTTLRDNIVFGRKGITEEDVKEACRLAHADEFIYQNELGLDYVVGTKGSKLSGGQKQRIALARAILNKPKILILDEATSALDNKCEKEIQKALASISQGITTIIVAHRLSTIRNADKIIVMKRGQIFEQGSHDELFEKQGLYYDLIKNEINIEASPEEEQPIVESVRADLHNVLITESNEELISDLVRRGSASTNGTNNSDGSDNLPPLDKRYTLFSIMMENKLIVFLGTFFACAAGCSWIVHASLSGDAIAILAKDDLEYVKEQGLLKAMQYIGFAIGVAIIVFCQNYLFSLQGDYITKRYRSLIYEKYLRMDISFYDNPNHSPGTLLSKLSQDSTYLNGVALGMFGVTIQIIVSSIIGISVSIYYSWKIGLVNLAFFPILLYLSGLQWKMRNGLITTTDQELENKAANILSEAICNSKTIFSYNMQDKVVDFYNQLLNNRHRAILKGGILNGLLYGLFQFVFFADYATMFYVGANFMLDPNDPVEFSLFLKSMCVSILVSFGLGNAQQHLGDMSKGKIALKNIYSVLREPVNIDPMSTCGFKPVSFKGKIEFKNVSFSYPTMQSTTVFENLNLTIEPGQKVAFVGPSGCGKSSIIQLIERFYDVTSGEVLIDGVNVKNYDLLSLRKNISLVMQEPVLFKTTNYDNIKYGKLDSFPDDVYRVADQVEIGKFLREAGGVNTIPSGGEKQRLAIARAILRNPKILLLDEATSALDNEKEKLVQASLEKVMEGKTTVAIAHRLVTVENFDVIYVMEKGKIVESGTHEELYAKQGIYYKLYNAGK
jgi:ATP-binding cassette subfamily B (MDR/TAP) protein 1